MFAFTNALYLLALKIYKAKENEKTFNKQKGNTTYFIKYHTIMITLYGCY